MSHFHRFGGAAAIGQAVTFIIGFWLYFTLLGEAGYGSLSADPKTNVQFLIEHKSVMYAWNLTIYVLFGILLLVQCLALHDRMKTDAPHLMQISTAFGLMWSTVIIACGMVANVGTDVVTTIYETDPDAAGAAWQSLSFVVNGLGGGNEIIGGLWVTLLSIAGLRTGLLPKWLHILGLIVGLSGLSTTIPPLSDLGAIFGLGLIVWYIWIGIALLRSK